MIRAAAVQIAPSLASREITTNLVLDAIGEASRGGAKLVVFPETFIPYYPYFSFVEPPVLMGRSHLTLLEKAYRLRMAIDSLELSPKATFSKRYLPQKNL